MLRSYERERGEEEWEEGERERKWEGKEMSIQEGRGARVKRREEFVR